jgi:predicted DNA-binding protein
MTLAIDKLKEAEVVLMNRIKRMKDGKPKWNASAQITEIRLAIDILSRLESGQSAIISTQQTAY